MKVTLSLPDDLLEAVEEYLAAHKSASRSGVCASALRDWIQARQDEQIEAYYSELSEEERAEDTAWQRAAGYSASKFWP